MEQTSSPPAAEYALTPADKGYARLQHRAFAAGILSILLAVVCIGFYRSAASPPYRYVPFSLLTISIGALFRAISSIRNNFPEWRAFHEKLLPPKENSELLASGLLIPVHESPRVEGYFLYLFVLIGLTLILCYLITRKHVLMLVMGTLMLCVCVYDLLRRRRITEAVVDPAIRGDAELIVFPLSVLEVTLADKLRRQGKHNHTIHWRGVRSWEVLSGGSDDPDLYRITEDDGRTIEVYRSRLSGAEITLLEFVRAAGVPVLLKDSVAPAAH